MGKRSRLTDKTPESYDFHLYPKGSLLLSQVDLDARHSNKDAADGEIEALSRTLFELQVECFLKKRRAIWVFEGWDAAGKGGVIKRITHHMDPRGYKVWPIAAPRDAEVRHHHLWRFFARLPEPGEIAIFDRSWYGRVLVERIEGFCTEEAWQRAYDEINAFERMLTDDGVILRKFFLHIDKATQLKRFKERASDRIKRYKIGPDDWRNRKKWKAYERAYQDMLDRTHRPDGPWQVVAANDKRLARLEVMASVAQSLR